MNEPDGFGQRLKTTRQQRGLTQETLAEQVGCAVQTIRKLEGNRRRPSFQMAARIAEVLALDPAERAGWMEAARAVRIPTHALPAPVPPTSLPTYLTPFVGRLQELTLLRALLGRPDYRLVTLLGPGGVGKTRLAVEVAAGIEGFRDGAAFVSLAPVATPRAIVPAIGDALGFNFSGPTDLLSQLVGDLSRRQQLLILDNLEHLLDPAGETLTLVQRLLAEAPEVTLLVTSRERLRLPGEWVRELGGLMLPPSDDSPRPVDYPACALFAEHAQRTDSSFQLGPETEAAIASICRLVGGMPLGIELAASWLRLLSPAAIGKELMRNLTAQHLSPGTIPARHRSLWSVVDHSWHLLPPPEQEWLARCSVFRGGFRRDAAQQVAGADLLALASLADKSLVRRLSEGRFDLHEIIRQYAAARLAEHPEWRDETLDRHAAYYCAWLCARRERLHGREQVAAMAEIRGEIDNLRAAWRWAARRGLLRALRQASDSFQWFLEFRSWFAEGTELFLAAADALRGAGALPLEAERRHTLGDLLARLAFLALRGGQTDLARRSISESLDLLDDCPDPLLRAHAFMFQAMVCFFVGEFDAAQVAVDRCRALTPDEEPLTHAFCDTWDNHLALVRGDYERAEQYFRMGLKRYRLMEHKRGIVIAATFCSASLAHLGKVQELETLLSEGLRLAGEIDDHYGVATALHQLGLTARSQGRHEEAVAYLRDALARFRMIGSQWDVSRVANALGSALVAAGQREEGGRILREALSTAAAARIVPEALEALVTLATVLEQEGRAVDARCCTAFVLADPAARTETRSRAQRLHARLEREPSGGPHAPVPTTFEEMIERVSESRMTSQSQPHG